MKSPFSSARILGPAFTIAACMLVGLACGGSEPTYEVTGIVRSIDAANRQLFIAHDVIPGFMPAMTMNFDVADPSLLEGLAPGDQIRFGLERTQTSLRILTVRKIDASGQLAGSSGAIPNDEPDIAPAFELIDQDGGTARSDDLRGHAVVLDFIFTRCEGPCPILTARHVALQRKLSPELRACTRFASISVDPEHDRPETLRSYALARGADLSTWTFLTGDPATVREVLAAYGVGSTDSPSGALEHTVATFLIDPQGNVARRYLGVSAAGEEIERDLVTICRNSAEP